MSEWIDNQQQSINSIRQSLQERIDRANSRRKQTAEETKRLDKLEGIATKLKCSKTSRNTTVLRCRSAFNEELK